MSVFDVGGYRLDGRIDGSYVYMLMCEDGGRIHAKIGMTDHPTRRLYALVNGCPLEARNFATVNVWSRKAAVVIERALHKAMARWRHHGEWFQFDRADRDDFNAAWKAVFTKHAKPSWPLSWVQTPVAPVIRLAAKRQRYWLRKNRSLLPKNGSRSIRRAYRGDAASLPKLPA